MTKVSKDQMSITELLEALRDACNELDDLHQVPGRRPKHVAKVEFPKLNKILTTVELPGESREVSDD